MEVRLPTSQEVEDLRRIVNLLDGKPPEGYTANPVLARRVIELRAVTYARWVLALVDQAPASPNETSK